MKFVTVATNNTGYYNTMLDSAEKNDIKVDVLGMGEKWYGYSMKIYKLKEYINSQKEEELVCFFDAYDVIFCNNSKNIEDTFLKLNKDIVIGCHEKPGVLINYFMKGIYNYKEKIESKSKYKYLCSGTIIGKAKNIKLILNNYKDYKNYKDDQVFWYDMYTKSNNPEIVMDCNNDLFYTSCPPKNIYNFILNKGEYNELEIKDGKVLNTYTNTKPSMIHFPGDSNMNDIIKQLNLKSDNDPEHQKRLVKKVKTYSSGLKLKQIILPFIILLLLCLSIYKRYFMVFIIIIVFLLFI